MSTRKWNRYSSLHLRFIVNRSADKNGVIVNRADCGETNPPVGSGKENGMFGLSIRVITSGFGVGATTVGLPSDPNPIWNVGK